MANDDQYVSEIARLEKTAAETRLRVVESQLSLAFTLCTVAETELQYGRPDEAIKAIDRVQHHAETVGFHLVDSNHLPTPAISNVFKQLTELKKRIEEIESRLHQQ